MSALTITQALVFGGFLWLLWKLLRRSDKSSFSNVPGPTSDSFLTGERDVLSYPTNTDDGVHTGHMTTLFHRHKGWAFHDMLSQRYGPIVRLRGMLGVSYILSVRRSTS